MKARKTQGRTAAAAVVFGVVAVTLAGCAGEGALLGETRTLAETGASNPTIAGAGGGAFLVAWVQQGVEGADVYVARLGADGLPEGDPVRANDVAGDATPHEQAPAQVAVGPGGEVYVVWQRRVDAPWLEFGGADLRLARSNDGGRTVEPAITVNDNPPGSPARISFHNIAVAADGTVHVSWIDARIRDHAREVAYHAMHSAHTATGSTPPHAAAEGTSGDGRSMMHVEEPGTEMRVAVSHDGGRTFEPSVVVDGDSCPCCRTALALGPDGAVYVGWRKIFEGGIRDIAVARSEDGGATFAAPRPVHQDHWEFPGCPHAGPSLALDDDGRLHAAWYTGRDGRQGLWYAVSEDSGVTFSEPIAILTDEWVPPSQARLAIVDGEVWVAWDDLRQETRRVRLARLEGSRFKELQTGAMGQSPSLAFADGHGALAWHDGESVRVLTIGS